MPSKKQYDTQNGWTHEKYVPSLPLHCWTLATFQSANITFMVSCYSFLQCTLCLKTWMRRKGKEKRLRYFSNLSITMMASANRSIKWLWNYTSEQSLFQSLFSSSSDPISEATQHTLMFSSTSSFHVLVKDSCIRK